MSKSTATIIESQLDWLTCAVHTGKKAEKLQRLASSWAHTTEQETNRQLPWRLMGYDGWRCGRVRYGERYGAAIVQLSGDLARAHFDTLSTLWDTVSRIDLAVTARVEPANDDLGRLHYQQASHWYTQHPKAARPSFHGDADGGYTCYLGDRTSDRFLRIYNKASESAADPTLADHYSGCWRYELESKGQTAGALGATLSGLTDEQRGLDIQDMLYHYLVKHGIQSPFRAVGGAKLEPGFRRRSDRETRLLWLERTVRPSIDWLRQTGDDGPIFSALGLAPFLADADRSASDE